MKIRLAALVVGVAVVAVAAVAWRVSRRAERAVRPSAARLGATLEGISLRGRDWELAADAATIGEDRDRVTLRNVRRASLRREGKTLLTVKCARLYLSRRTGDMEFAGRVRVGVSGGLRVETESLRWDAEKQLMSGAAPAVVSLGDAAMKVSALSYSARDKRLECTRGVRLATADSYVAGERMVVLLQRRQVHLAGNIRARMAVDEAEEFVSAGPGGVVKRLLSFPPL